MLKKKFTKLIGLKYEDFLAYQEDGQIITQNARLIPTLKTGDEGALASIFLTTLKLVKEYRDTLFKELKLSRGSNIFYFTEVAFPEVDKNSRCDGLIMIVSKGVIKEAIVFEMKNKNNSVDKVQVEKYMNLCKKIGVNKMATISNEFVADSTQSPVNVKSPKNFSLYHFSWTYLMTKGRLLLFKNENIIKDEDQIEIMREVLYYFESPVSGISGYTIMKPGWKELVEKIKNRVPLKVSDPFIEEAIISWHEEEKDMALHLSQKLGVLVKSSSKGKDKVKEDTRKIINDQSINGNLSIKNSVSDIKISVDFEIKSVSMTVKVIPPLDKGTVARITWIGRQLEACKKKNEEVFSCIEKDILVEADVKYAKEHLRVKLSELDRLIEESKGKEITSFNIVLMSNFGAGFGSTKKFIVLIEKMLFDYYAGIVQYLTNWNRPAPRL